MRSTLYTAALFVAVATHTVNAGHDHSQKARFLSPAAAEAGDADTNRQCHTQNSNYLPVLAPGKYATSTFHKCFRTDAQIFEFLDTLTKQNSGSVSKFQISTTHKGLPIWAYKVSTGKRTKSLYTQSLQHAREWVAGSSVVFTLASLLDDVAAKKPTPADNYDLVFVPIVNIDGYRITWSSNRMQRKNANEVDLNRNWYTPIANPDPPSPSADDYPGESFFSEKETRGLRDYFTTNNASIAGLLDVHSVAGEVQVPFGDTDKPIGNGIDEKYQILGNAVASAMGPYKTTIEWEMYFTYGCFEDWGQRYLNKPTLTIEMAGNGFSAPTSSIVKSGKELYRGLYAFARAVPQF